MIAYPSIILLAVHFAYTFVYISQDNTSILMFYLTVDVLTKLLSARSDYERNLWQALWELLCMTKMCLDAGFDIRDRLAPTAQKEKSTQATWVFAACVAKTHRRYSKYSVSG